MSPESTVNSMVRIESREAFDAFARAAREDDTRCRAHVSVCCGTGCVANGARRLVDAFAAELDRQRVAAGLGMLVKKTGCHGFCQRGPLVVIEPAGILYTRVKPHDVAEIVEKTVGRGEVVGRLLYRDPCDRRTLIERYEDIPFYRNQTRIAMRNIGRVDPGELRDAVAHGAYAGLVRALFEMQPAEVVEEVERSGLRGRGGAGFPTGRKWRACRQAEGSRKFVVCNGDEGDPGAFKDRSLMEGDPHSVLEGLAIGAYAVGALEGYIYVRDEYPLAVAHLTAAIEQARACGLLGGNILGSGTDFDVRLSRGGGAFVCGESSALMRSIAGKTGEPRAKYVHATTRGLFDCPTVLNNVETWADVGAVLQHGADWFAARGTSASPGTKTFSLVGKVKNAGLVEVPMGTTLRHIIFDVGGGVLGDRPFKAVQTGGPSGGCLPASALDLPVDYEQLTRAGSMMGSGGMIVMDDRTCMVDVARYFLRFLVEESCGKCTPCREGLRQMLLIFDRLVGGNGVAGDLDRIERLGRGMQVASLCELGRSAPNPVLSTLRNFRDEYEAHVDGRCPAGVCRELTTYAIDAAVCNGCHVCVGTCPVGAVSGERKEVHAIDHRLCLSCGACFDACNMHAVRFLPRREAREPVLGAGSGHVAGPGHEQAVA